MPKEMTDFEKEWRAISKRDLLISEKEGECTITLPSKTMTAKTKDECIKKILYHAKLGDFSEKHSKKTNKALARAMIVEDIIAPAMSFAYEYQRDLRILQYFEQKQQNHLTSKEKKKVLKAIKEEIEDMYQLIKRYKSPDFTRISKIYEETNGDDRPRDLTIEIFERYIELWQIACVTKGNIVPAMLKSDKNGDTLVNGERFRLIT